MTNEEKEFLDIMSLIILAHPTEFKIMNDVNRINSFITPIFDEWNFKLTHNIPIIMKRSKYNKLVKAISDLKSTKCELEKYLQDNLIDEIVLEIMQNYNDTLSDMVEKALLAISGFDYFGHIVEG